VSQELIVAYASRAGSTAEVAEVIGQVLREGGSGVEVRPVKEVQRVAAYDAIVLGTAIWAGKPLPEARQFVAAQQSALATRPVAYFALCELLREDTPVHRDRAYRFLDSLRRIQEPVDLQVFAGKKDYGALHPLVRWVMLHLLHSPEGDWRDWNQIRAWATTLAPRLTYGMLADTASYG
jgi:menaquinone-dependent protoporphyrinogen oxidase